MGLTAQQWQFFPNYRQGHGFFLFATASRTAPGLTQPHIQWVPAALFPGVNRPGREADFSSPSSAEITNALELYIHSSIHLHGMVLSQAQGQLYHFTFTC
jgi:hypothetical protein